MSAKTTDKPVDKPRTPKPAQGDYKLIQLSDIFVDEKWNARSGNWKEDDGYKALLASLTFDGQIYTPLEVVKSEGFGSKTTKPYTLIAGFRRITAALELSWKQAPCLVLTLTPAKAQLRNLQENTAREGFKVPDLVFSLCRLGENATNKEIAEDCSLSVPWVTKLKKIGNDLVPTVFAKWRASNLLIAVRDMQRISEAPKDKQELMWAALVQDLSSKTPVPKGKWIEHAIKRAGTLGQEVGKMVAAGLLMPGMATSENVDLSIATTLGKIPPAAKASDDDRRKVIDTFIRGIQTGQDIQTATTADTSNEETGEMPV